VRQDQCSWGTSFVMRRVWELPPTPNAHASPPGTHPSVLTCRKRDGRQEVLLIRGLSVECVAIVAWDLETVKTVPVRATEGLTQPLCGGLQPKGPKKPRWRRYLVGGSPI
jgi:hypothetical protein